MKIVTQCIKRYDHLKVFQDANLRPQLNVTLCTFPIFADFPTASIRLIYYSHVTYSSTINSRHHQWPFLMYCCTRFDLYFAVLFVITQYFDSCETMIFGTKLNLNKVRSEKIWPLIKPCISKNRVRAKTNVRNCALHKQLYPIHQSRYSQFALRKHTW